MKKLFLMIILVFAIFMICCGEHEHKFINGYCECGAIEPHSHKYDEWIVVKEATETEEGLKESTCVCGEKETEIIERLEHIHNFIEGKCTCGETIEVLVESLEINGKEEMLEGEEQTLTAVVFPEYATNKDVIWSSSDETIATVENGLVKALKEGLVTIQRFSLFH